MIDIKKISFKNYFLKISKIKEQIQTPVSYIKLFWVIKNFVIMFELIYF